MKRYEGEVTACPKCGYQPPFSFNTVRFSFWRQALRFTCKSCGAKTSFLPFDAEEPSARGGPLAGIRLNFTILEGAR